MLNDNDNDKSVLKYYYPFCKVKGCNGILKFQINEEKMNIDYICTKNSEHQKNNLYFNVFEKYYLKEGKENVYICCKCLYAISSNTIFKCKQCKNIYCEQCYLSDTHINDNLDNLIYKEQNKKKINLDQKCTKCNNNVCYCFDCNKKICIYCSDFHRKHKTIILGALSQNNESFNYLKNQVEEKSKINEELIYSIDEWENNLKKKLDILKNKLRNEINFLKKITFNFNPFLDNLIYYYNFWNIYYYLKNININNIKKFKGSLGFEEQTRYITKLLLQKDFQVENKIGYVHINNNIENSILHKIDENYYFTYGSFYDKTSLGLRTIDENYNIQFNEKVCSISSSKDKKEIYLCLLEEKKVLICECNLALLTFILSKDEIMGNSLKYKDHFNKCIQITNNYLATSDDTMISIWTRIIDNIEKKKKEYINIINIKLDTKISDLLSINDEYFISCQPIKKTISFINIPNFKEDKIILDDKFEFYKSENCLFLLNQYIAINCLKGIALIYIKTKEIVKYIENNFEKKYICLNNLDNFYIITLFNNDIQENIYLYYNPLFLWGRIEQFKHIDGCFECIENYGEIYSNENSKDFNPSNIIFIKNNFIYYRYKYFSLEEKIMGDVRLSDSGQGCYKILLDKNNIKS